jgi:hypothetical protein
MSVSANGLPIGRLVLTRHTLASFYIPPLDYTSKALSIVISHPDCHQGHPGHKAISISFFRVRLNILDEPMPERSNLSRSTPVADARDAETTASMPLRELALKFESLGPSCEFGFVQRRCGAEPLGLMRFSGITLPRLVAAIDSGFAGLDDPDNLMPEGNWDWSIRDKIYDISYHTFRRCSEVAASDLKQSESRRLRFLIRKFMDDLANAEKILVWWQRRPMAEPEILSLFLALHRRGPVRLLWVVKDSPAGLVEEVLPGLMRGRIADFGEAGNENDEKSFPGWLPMMVNAFLLANPD